MGLPAGAKRLEASIAIGQVQGDTEDVAEFTIEVRHGALWSLHHADGQIRHLPELLRQPVQGFTFTLTGFAGDQGETAVGGQRLQAQGESLSAGQAPQSLGWQGWQEGIVFKTVDRSEGSVIHRFPPWAGRPGVSRWRHNQRATDPAAPAYRVLEWDRLFRRIVGSGFGADRNCWPACPGAAGWSAGRRCAHRRATGGSCPSWDSAATGAADGGNERE